MPNEIVWLTFETISQMHQRSLEKFNGLTGIKDEGSIHSAIQSAADYHHYEGVEDILALAIRLCSRLVHNHGFNDGNKRAGAGALLLFLEVNGFEVTIDRSPGDDGETQLSHWIKALAAHELDEDALYDLLEPLVV